MGSTLKSVCPPPHRFIKETRLFKYIENFTTKAYKFSDKNSDIFYISALNIDCGYLLELVPYNLDKMSKNVRAASHCEAYY